MDRQEVIETLTLADQVLWEVAQEAGDVDYWNVGGLGYRTALSVAALLAKLQRES